MQQALLKLSSNKQVPGLATRPVVMTTTLDEGDQRMKAYYVCPMENATHQRLHERRHACSEPLPDNGTIIWCIYMVLYGIYMVINITTIITRARAVATEQDVAVVVGSSCMAVSLLEFLGYPVHM